MAFSGPPILHSCLAPDHVKERRVGELCFVLLILLKIISRNPEDSPFPFFTS